MPKLNLLSQEISYVTNCKYLGIQIDHKLNMNLFMKQVKQQVLHKIYMLGKIRKYLIVFAAVTIFKTMLLPFFEYGSIFLNICNDYRAP